MCGIYGFISGANYKENVTNTQKKQLVLSLIQHSISRGKDASGVCTINKKEIKILKRPISANKLSKTKEFNRLFEQNQEIDVAIGHARMETNGSFAKNYNNQPVVKDGIITIHNGIIVNVDQLWEENKDIKREFEVDTEVINSLLRKHLNQASYTVDGIYNAFKHLKGAYSTATFFNDLNIVLLATNTGSLYLCKYNDHIVFASQKNYLNSLIQSGKLPQDTTIQQISADEFWIINTRSLEIQIFNLRNNKNTNFKLEKHTREIIEVQPENPDSPVKPINLIKNNSDLTRTKKLIEDHYAEIYPVINTLKRCSKCILPTTFPFITFDSDGVCNYCHNYYIVKPKGEAELVKLITQFKNNKKTPDCLIAFSGGRDSSYGLYYIVEKLGLNPITYTYDWGMVTDLARRNIARMTGQLGIENILISADITYKRKNVKKNLESWLKKPELGMIPLLMAGDKHFLYYVNRVKRAYDIKLDIWMTNRLESTEFKYGFCNASPNFETKGAETLSKYQKFKMAMYYLKNFATNIGYLNSSILDTIWSFQSYYFEPRTHLIRFYDYISWDEEKINSTLINLFDWETSPDTPGTWRIGDGTASLYNYVYYTICGFSENDAFRSNQIREGKINRTEALAKTAEENKPRTESLKWYFDTVDVNFHQAIEVINKQPKLYSKPIVYSEPL